MRAVESHHANLGYEPSLCTMVELPATNMNWWAGGAYPPDSPAGAFDSPVLGGQPSRQWLAASVGLSTPIIPPNLAIDRR